MAGVVALRDIPVAALPRYNTPIIQVTAYLPGAEPGHHGLFGGDAAGKAVLHHRRPDAISSDKHAGPDRRWRSSSTPARDIDAAAVDVQAALLRAQRTLPAEMTTPPSYRKVNPADAPVLFVSLTLALDAACRS